MKAFDCKDTTKGIALIITALSTRLNILNRMLKMTKI